ncbi:catechol 1,2-dioxygenase [Gordonia desulfuricans]|uniref:Catechol 1,2-dioxygenase n=1 Tax=Gordonia desulfuricans TaxID=89051 RepID=A0A7K3LM66_9ACTN|nr:hypothetical protein [Gordonia desulfuricans]NDK89273.1 catechol 1,2-dioxygenase [Gordonia desulfuricans]
MTAIDLSPDTVVDRSGHPITLGSGSAATAFVEHHIDAIDAREFPGPTGSVEGSYYLADAPLLPARCTLPMRSRDRAQPPLVLYGQVLDVSGAPVPGATLEIWHADAEGHYSGYTRHVPDWNLRGTVVTDGAGRYEITTIAPAPQQIPADGPTGTCGGAADRHPRQPAHLNLRVSGKGQHPVITQLYLTGDRRPGGDVTPAAGPGSLLDPEPDEQGRDSVRHDFVLDPG